MMSLDNRLALVFGFTIAVVAVPSKVTGQNAAVVHRSTFWGTIALGQAAITDSGMIHSSIGLSLQRQHLIVSGRVSANQQGQSGNYRTRIGDVGILAGYATTPKALHFSVAGGLAVVRDINDSTTIGLPIEAYATWRFLPWAGLGLRVFGVGNKLADYGGISLALQVGRLR